jgi:pimeloyl-ACP methyl ester carboxylesterase
MKIFLGVACVCLVVLVIGGAFLYTPDMSRAALEAKYRLSPDDFVEVAGIRLHVVQAGRHDLPCVVMLHGFGSSLQTFDAWSVGLAARYHVVRLDLPGFGLTGRDPTGDYSDARSMNLLAGLLDRLGVARASFVGNSMGGRLAWEFAAARPERVEKLILISPDGFASTGFEYGRAPAVPWMLRLLPYTMPKAMLRATLAPAYADPKRLSDGEVDRYWDFMRAPGVRQAVIDQGADAAAMGGEGCDDSDFQCGGLFGGDSGLPAGEVAWARARAAGGGGGAVAGGSGGIFASVEKEEVENFPSSTAPCIPAMAC